MAGNQMGTIPSPATAVHVRSGPYWLSAFDESLASLVVGWVVDASELFWLAPKTPPPLTAAKVLAWSGPDSSPRMFCREGLAEPLGYLELNPMPGETGHLWLGHCLIRPDCRGRGLGRLMVKLILEEAFGQRRAGRVSLVVFPDNLAAIRCYRAIGFEDAGQQVKYFLTTGRHHRMVRMEMDKARYELIYPRPEPS